MSETALPPALPVPTTPTAPAVPTIPVHWTFPADLACVRYARRAVAQALPSACQPQLADPLTLLASELVANAVRYGPRPATDHVVELTLWPADGHYWLAVSDAGDGRPALRAPHAGACGGRGLVLVDALAAAWAVVPRPVRGKSVVAGIRLPDA